MTTSGKYLPIYPTFPAPALTEPRFDCIRKVGGCAAPGTHGDDDCLICIFIRFLQELLLQPACLNGRRNVKWFCLFFLEHDAESCRSVVRGGECICNLTTKSINSSVTNTRWQSTTHHPGRPSCHSPAKEVPEKLTNIDLNLHEPHDPSSGHECWMDTLS